MEDQNTLFRPFIPTTTTTISSTNDNVIIIRFLSIFFIAIITIWANYEASKGFEITIINQLPKHSHLSKRFDLFYVSNDKATRIILNTSNFVEHLLYNNINDNNYSLLPKKQVSHVILRFSNLFISTTFGKENSFVIDINPMIMEDMLIVNNAMVLAILRGMSRVWIWEGGSGLRSPPPELVAGMVEYICIEAGFSRVERYKGRSELPEYHGEHCFWWEDKDPKVVARFLSNCEKHHKGFIQRLNRALKDGWHDPTVDDARGLQVDHDDSNLCGLYTFSNLKLSIRSGNGSMTLVNKE